MSKLIKKTGRLIGLGNKKKDDDDEKKRGFMSFKKPTQKDKSGSVKQPPASQVEQSLKMQKDAYYNEKSRRETHGASGAGNYDLERYQSVHADQFKEEKSEIDKLKEDINSRYESEFEEVKQQREPRQRIVDDSMNHFYQDMQKERGDTQIKDLKEEAFERTHNLKADDAPKQEPSLVIDESIILNDTFNLVEKEEMAKFRPNFEEKEEIAARVSRVSSKRLVRGSYADQITDSEIIAKMDSNVFSNPEFKMEKYQETRLGLERVRTSALAPEELLSEINQMRNMMESEVEDKKKDPEEPAEIELPNARRRITLIQENRKKLKEDKIQAAAEEAPDPIQEINVSQFEIEAQSIVDKTLAENAEIEEEILKERQEQAERVALALPRFREVLEELVERKASVQALAMEDAFEQRENESMEISFLNDFYGELNFERDFNDPSSLPSISMNSAGALAAATAPSKKHQSTLEDRFDSDFTKEASQMIKFIDWNEKRHRNDAKAQLKKNQAAKAKKQSHLPRFTQHRLSTQQQLKFISQKLAMEKQFKNSTPTCVAVSDDLILIGNTMGQLMMFARDSQELYETFVEKSIQSNPITCIDIHPQKSEYVLIGYQQGQIVLMDVTEPTKSIKVVKDAHKNAPVVTVNFTQAITKQLSQATIQASEDIENPYGANPYMENKEDLKEWVFISVDKTGRTVFSTISRSYFMNKVTKLVIVDSYSDVRYLTAASRFVSSMFPQPKQSDTANLVALGGRERVSVYLITGTESYLIKQIRPPLYYTADGERKVLNLQCPSLSWGYGHSPIFKDRMYSTLAIAWGPLVQTFILNDPFDEAQPFIDDGYIILGSQDDESSSGTSMDAAEIEKRREQLQKDISVYDQRYDSVHQLNQKGSSQFELSDQFIDRMFFLSESTLLTVTRLLEIRLLYIRKFRPGPYTPEVRAPPAVVEEGAEGLSTTVASSAPASTDKVDRKRKQLDREAQIDHGMYLSNLSQSQLGQSYDQTLRQFTGMVITLGAEAVFQMNHVNWEENLRQIKEEAKGNWSVEINQIMDFYSGRIKGFKDVPEDDILRHETLKAELKLLVSEIIMEQIAKWQPEPENPYEENPYAASNQNLDSTLVEDLQLLGQKDKDTTEQRQLIRLSIEFCVLVEDSYFLFYDLFQSFQDVQLEDIFLDELKPFILAGKFSSWELPEDILQNHIINYYKDSNKPELIESIIVNLNLSQCPQPVVLDLIQFSEENFLSSALLFLHTSITEANEEEEGRAGIQVVLSLLDLYRKAKETNPGSLEEVKCIQHLPVDSIERQKAQKSQAYLGYKILWAIRLLLHGKKFPSGNLSKEKWKQYVHQMVDCITSKNIMLDLLIIDAEAYFQIVSILFMRGPVFDFIQQGKDQQQQVIAVQQKQVSNPIISNDVYEELMPYLSHNEIIGRLDSACQSTKELNYQVPDDIRLQYLFFVAHVASKANIDKEPKFYFSIIIEILEHTAKFLKINKNYLQKAVTRQAKRSFADETPKVDEKKHIVMAENALIELVELCRPLDDSQLDLLLEKTQYTKFSLLREKLLEERRDYPQCLQLFIEGLLGVEASADRIAKLFDWTENILLQFESKKTFDQRDSSAEEDAFRRQVLASFKDLVNISASRTFKLIDMQFPNKHEELVEKLEGNQKDKFDYLDAIFNINHKQVQSCIEDYLLSGQDREKAESLISLQNQHLRLLCEHYPAQVIDRVRRIKKNEVHFTLDTGLEICKEYNQVEACAILSRKMSNYLGSVTSYITLITEAQYFDYADLIRQIDASPSVEFVPYLSKEQKTMNKVILRAWEKGLASLPEGHPFLRATGIKQVEESEMKQSLVMRFDSILRKVMKQCERDATENYNEETIHKIWFFSLDKILKARSDNYRILDLLIEEQNGLLPPEPSADDEKKPAEDMAAESKPATEEESSKPSSQPIEYTPETKPEAKDKSMADHLEDDDKPLTPEEVDEVKHQIRRLEQMRDALQEFYRPRVQFLVETTLKYIELDEFLEHIVKHDELLAFMELKQIIFSIFSEYYGENVVLTNAIRSTQKQIFEIFGSCGAELSTGVLFSQNQCHLCGLNIAQVLQQKQRLKEITRYARRGTFISHKAFLDSDSDELFEDPHLEEESKKMRIYDCGHAFHMQCILSHFAKKQEGTGVSLSEVEQSKCPWCFSGRFSIDFDSIFKKQSRRRGGHVASKLQQLIGVSQFTEKQNELSNPLQRDNSVIVNQSVRIPVFKHKEKNSLSSKEDREKELIIQEQKLTSWERLFQREAVTSQNFIISKHM